MGRNGFVFARWLEQTGRSGKHRNDLIEIKLACRFRR